MERKHGSDKDPNCKSRVTEDGKFKCGECGKLFELAKYWSDHHWKCHNVEDVPCPVVECGVVLSGKGGLEFQGHWNLVHKVSIAP